MNIFWLLRGGGPFLGSVRQWWVYFGWWWVVVGGGGYILAGGGSWWMVVGRGGWWHSLVYPNKQSFRKVKNRTLIKTNT